MNKETRASRSGASQYNPKGDKCDSLDRCDSHDGHPQDDRRDLRLARLLSDLSDRAIAGQPVVLDEVLVAHPEFAGEIRQLWGAVMVADAVGSYVAVDAAATSSVRSGLAAMIDLPCRFGDYQLWEELGRGGMGIVYRARQMSLDREVAVKMLLRGGLASPEEEARFRHEAEAAARLNHPNVVPVYEVGTVQGRLFFSMKYVAGRTLSDLLSQGPLLPRATARLLVTVCRAIEYAHLEGVLHRDLKPSNILIDDHDQPHITDFGLARRVSDEQPVTDALSITRTGAILGTPAYMAPEQAAGNRGQVGPASDVYSLGSVLYHMLTGRPPFQAASPVDVVLMVLEQDPVAPRVLNPKVDRDLEMIAMRCLQKPVDLRYSTAGQLADDLDAYLNDELVSARSGRISQVVARWFRETHHAPILENWGLLWMWHSLALIVICLLTNAIQRSGDDNRWHYFMLWTLGLGTWASVFWALRHRMGPVTFVERQIAHLWAASMISIALLFPIEWALDLPVLKLSPVVALTSGMIFLVKAGILSGWFYIQSVALFGTALVMAQYPDWAHTIFGFVSAACFFFPGWKYHRQRRHGLRGHGLRGHGLRGHGLRA